MELHCSVLGWLKDDCRSICVDFTALRGSQTKIQCAMFENPQYACGLCIHACMCVRYTVCVAQIESHELMCTYTANMYCVCMLCVSSRI